MPSVERLEISLLALFLLTLLVECRFDNAEAEVTLVAAESDAESRELVVGVLVYVVDPPELRLGVKLDLALALPGFFTAFSKEGEELECASPPVTGGDCSGVSTC